MAVVGTQPLVADHAGACAAPHMAAAGGKNASDCGVGVRSIDPMVLEVFLDRQDTQHTGFCRKTGGAWAIIGPPRYRK